MSIFKERKSRKFQTIADVQKFSPLIDNYLVGKSYYLKSSFPPRKIKVIKKLSNDRILVETKAILEEHAILYRNFNKFMEVPCILVEPKGPEQFILEVKALKIAIDNRQSDRANVNPEIVSINNIRAAKNLIQASLFNIPPSVTVLFAQYEKQLKHFADEVKIEIFDKKCEKQELVRKSCKTFWIKNTQDTLDYMPENTELFVDYHAFLHVELDDVMREYRKEKIISEVIIPIVFIGHDGNSIPLGMIQLISKSKEIDELVILELQAKTFEMVDRIRESNTMLINTKQEINNISKNGLQLKITDDELKKFLIHQKGFSFDIVFKLQQPVTVMTEIKYLGTLESGDLLIGVKILGSSSRKGEAERYVKYIDALLDKKPIR